ncbi:MAG: hypothetical protein ACI8RZ_000333 [Myxococcota bacterium]
MAAQDAEIDALQLELDAIDGASDLAALADTVDANADAIDAIAADYLSSADIADFATEDGIVDLST